MCLWLYASQFISRLWYCPVRAAPTFPRYRTAKPPATRRWLAAGSLLTLLAGGGSTLLQGVNTGSGSAILVMLIAMMFAGFLWLYRVVYYRCSVHHTATWKRGVEHEQSLWWAEHQRRFSLSEVVLIGPAGSAESDWIRVLTREQQPPAERQESQGAALRIARTFSEDVAAREQQLARLLVLQWKKGRHHAAAPLMQCFWQGSEAAWLAFRAQMKTSFPDIVLPASPEPWCGETSLSLIADLLSHAKDNGQWLVAGCQSLPASSERLRPAGESAVLWLVGSAGPVMISRGEVFDLSPTGSLAEVCERAQTQSSLDAAPDACILFSHPQRPELAGSGWNVTHNLQDRYWGELGNMEPLVVISLAAMLAQHHEHPCGWIATDPQHTLALGIVKPHGNG